MKSPTHEMNLRNRQFEKAMKARVREFDLLRRMTFWQKCWHWLNSPLGIGERTLWVMRGMITATWIILPWYHAESVVTHPQIWLAAVACWVWMISAGRGFAYLPKSYLVMWLLPLSPDQIFGRLRKRFWLSAGLMAAESFSISFLAVANSGQGLTDAALAVCGAVCQGVLSLAMTCLIISVRWNPGAFLMAGAFAAYIFAVSCTTRYAPEIARFILWTTPTGWCSGLFMRGNALDITEAFPNLVPAVLLVVTLPWALCAIKRRHDAGEFRQVNIGRPGELGGKLMSFAGLDLERPWAEPEQDTSLLGRWLYGKLTPRQRTMAAMAGIPLGHFTGRYLKLVGTVALLLILNRCLPPVRLVDLVTGMIIGARVPVIDLAVIGLTLLLIAVVAARTFSLVACLAPCESARAMPNGRHLAFQSYRLFPVSYWEVAEVLVKVQLRTVALIVPLIVLVAGAPWLQLFEVGEWSWVKLVIKVVTAVLCAPPLAASFRLLPYVAWGWRYWRYWWRPLVSTGLSYLVLTWTMIPAEMWLICPLAPVLAGVSLWWFRRCGYYYNQGVRAVT